MKQLDAEGSRPTHGHLTGAEPEAELTQLAGFELALNRVFQPAGLGISDLVVDPAATDYAGHELTLGSRRACFRASKRTPLKKGQFVTLWKRSAEGPIRPLRGSDGIDLVIIAVASGKDYGVFCFPTEILQQRGIFQSVGAEGKRAFRLYPPWESELNTQARGSQRWQSKFFIDLSDNSAAAHAALRDIFLN